MKSNDHIRLLGIEGYGYHGVLASERQEGQPFTVDLELHLDTGEAARTDALGHTANYAEIAAAVVKVIEGEPANLIETLAARIADTVLEFKVEAVSVTIHKPQAPVGVPFSDVQVSIHRDAPTGVTWEPAGPGLVEIGTSEPAADATQSQPPAAVVAPSEPEEPAAALVAAAAPSLMDNEGIPNGSASESSDELDAPPSAPVEIVLALGGNIGNVRQTLRDAITDLDRTEGIEVREVSALARTAPVTHADAVAQDDYLNAVVLARTTLSPRGLLAVVHRIEDAYGRVRVERWGDRTLDIDIITYGELISSEADLTLPHPRAAQRAFVLVPWVQVDPTGVIPGVDGGAISELADRAPDRKGVRWLALDWLTEEPALTDVAPRMAEAEPPAKAQEAAEAGEPAKVADPAPAPAGVEEKSEELPSVEEWLAASTPQEQQYADAAPALPVAGLPEAGPEHPDVSPERPVASPEPAEPASSGATSQAEIPGVDWLRSESEAPELSAKPRWFKVNPDE